MAKVKPLHKRGKHVKGDELDDAEGAYDRAVAGLEAFVAQRQDIIAASQKVRFPPSRPPEHLS